MTHQEFTQIRMAEAIDQIKTQVAERGSIQLQGSIGQIRYRTTHEMADTIPSQDDLQAAGLKMTILRQGNERMFTVVEITRA